MKGKTKMKNKIKTAAKIIAGLAIVLAGIALYNHHVDERMDRYAEENNCTWHYSYYINEQPICK